MGGKSHTPLATRSPCLSVAVVEPKLAFLVHAVSVMSVNVAAFVTPKCPRP